LTWPELCWLTYDLYELIRCWVTGLLYNLYLNIIRYYGLFRLTFDLWYESTTWIIWIIIGFLYNLYLIFISLIRLIDMWLKIWVIGLNCVNWSLTWDMSRWSELCGLSGLTLTYDMGRWPELCELIGFWSLDWIEYWMSVDNETG
jgi:hypothetical protein